MGEYINYAFSDEFMSQKHHLCVHSIVVSVYLKLFLIRVIISKNIFLIDREQY